MASFDIAFDYIIREEGGFVDDADDDGGATNYGISLRFLRSCGNKYDFLSNGISADSIKALTLAQAKTIYLNEFWENDFSEVWQQDIVNYLFDMVVNMGKSVAVKLLQRSLWAIGVPRSALVDDGIFGALTLSAVNRNEKFPLLCAMRANRAAYYRATVKANPMKMKYWNGWMTRTYEPQRLGA